jgi:hypothetical protein
MPKNQLPRYDAAFKRRAVEQVFLRQRPVAEVARQMGCSPQAVRNWVDQHQESLASSSIIQSASPQSSKSSVSRTTFLPLQVEGTDMPSFVGARIEIVTKSGLTLRFSGDTSPDLLIGLVRRLEVVPC